MNPDDIIGTWKLLKHGFVNSAGVFTPTASSMTGQLIYTSAGSMSVLILKNLKPKTLDDLIVYSGRYSCEDNKILHHIDISPSPTRRGTTEVRLMTLDSHKLILKTEPDTQGHFEITWVRP